MIKRIIHDTVSLVVITIVAGVCLAFVHGLTADTIATAEAEERAESYREVFPEAADFKDLDDMEGMIEKVASSGILPAGVTIGEARYAVDSSGNVIGCVVSSTSANGYVGDITLSVGVKNDGTITGMTVTSMSETSGLGAHCQDKDFQEQFKGISGEVVYVKDGADEPGEIDMISGATFTSRAVTEAVNGATGFVKYQQIATGGEN